MPEPENHVLLIFNHGSFEEDYSDICLPTMWTMPEVIRALNGQKINGLDIVIYNFCSTPAGRYDPVTGRGQPKVIKRTEAIEVLVRAFEKEGVPPQHIFLVGNSAGGWASLLVAARHRVAFNAVIAFGPAFAGKKASRSPGWEALRQQQIGLLSEANRIDGLVYAYADDPYEASADLAFLGKVAGIRLVPVDGQKGPGDGCDGPYGHRTAFRTCFLRRQESVILGYLAARLAVPRRVH